MAHVCYCHKDSVIVFGGMSQDHTVKSDLAVLKFGKIEINISNGSGVNPKRKFTKILNVTARTIPSLFHQESETANLFCYKCGHASSTCIFLERFSDIIYPTLSYFPRVQISTSFVEQLAAQFSDPFGALLRIGEVLGTPNISFSIIGTANFKGNQIVKILPSESNKETIKENCEEGSPLKNINTINAPILEVSTKLELLPEQVMKLCSGLSLQSLLPSFFRLSDTGVIISRTKDFFSVALLHKSEQYVPLFFVVFDNNNQPLYPSTDLVHSTMVNVFS